MVHGANLRGDGRHDARIHVHDDILLRTTTRKCEVVADEAQHDLADELRGGVVVLVQLQHLRAHVQHHLLGLPQNYRAGEQQSLTLLTAAILYDVIWSKVTR